MKKVWLAQPTNRLGNSVFLPYSVGTLAAYAWQFSDVCAEYALQDFLFLKEPVGCVLSKVDDPYLVAFSCYMWNVEYNLALAKAIKERWPTCILVFGGPQISRDTAFLEHYPFLDVLQFGEGEKTFCALLRALYKKEDLDTVCNIAFRRDGTARMTAYAPAGDISTYPSAYTSHYFDSILQNPAYADLQLDAVIETNRGCPYNCLFCTWGGCDETLRRFPMEKVEAEIRWLSENKIRYCVCADGNFGIFPRDVQIASLVAQTKQQTGFPEKFETTAAKNKDDRVFRISEILHNAGLNRGFSVACQSLSPRVLENIGRRNFSVEDFTVLLKHYRDAGICTYTDLILGLPGETYDSFCDGFFTVIEAGQHNAIIINRCELLPNAPMSSAAVVKKYGIKTISSKLCQFHSRIQDDDALGSRSEVVVETNTLSRVEWRKAERLCTCVYAFHTLGLLRWISVYLRQAKGVAYKDFYMTVFDLIEESDSFLKQTLDYVAGSIDVFLRGQGSIKFTDSRFGDYYIPPEEGMFLCCVAEYERFYDTVTPLLKPFFDDGALFTDLLHYQIASLNLPSVGGHTDWFAYDWPPYFRNMYNPLPRTPEKRECRYTFWTERYDDFRDYAREVVWYGKRDGKTLLSDVRIIDR